MSLSTILIYFTAISPIFKNVSVQLKNSLVCQKGFEIFITFIFHSFCIITWEGSSDLPTAFRGVIAVR